jgi:hypothetical protein
MLRGRSGARDGILNWDDASVISVAIVGDALSHPAR